MGFVLYLLIFLAFVGVVLYAGRRMANRQRAVEEHVERDDVSTVRHPIPSGVDPAVAIAHLHQAGYEAVEDPHAMELVVPYETAEDKIRIERIVAEAPPVIEEQ